MFNDDDIMTTFEIAGQTDDTDHCTYDFDKGNDGTGNTVGIQVLTTEGPNPITYVTGDPLTKGTSVYRQQGMSSAEIQKRIRDG